MPIIVLTILGTVVGGPVGAAIGFVIGLFLIDDEEPEENEVDDSEVPDEATNVEYHDGKSKAERIVEKRTEDGLPYVFKAKLKGLNSKHAKLEIHENRVSVVSKVSDESEDIPYSSVNKVSMRNGDTLSIEPMQGTAPNLEFKRAEVARKVKDLIMDTMGGSPAQGDKG